MEWARQRKPKCRAENVSLMLLTSSRYFSSPSSLRLCSIAHIAPLPAAQDKYLSPLKLRSCDGVACLVASLFFRGIDAPESKGSRRFESTAEIRKFYEWVSREWIDEMIIFWGYRRWVLILWDLLFCLDILSEIIFFHQTFVLYSLSKISLMCDTSKSSLYTNSDNMITNSIFLSHSSKGELITATFNFLISNILRTSRMFDIWNSTPLMFPRLRIFVMNWTNVCFNFFLLHCLLIYTFTQTLQQM